MTPRPIAFTPRELQILCAAASGKGQMQIADSLGIARRTCSAHLQHIYTKIGIRGVQRKGPSLTAWARENGYSEGGQRQ